MTVITGKGELKHKGDFAVAGIFDFPIVVRQNVFLGEIGLIGFSEIKNEEKEYDFATIHFFEGDEKFDEVWNNPSRYIPRLKQYRQVLSPDFSQYMDMPKAIQIFNVYRNRWCAAYWQQKGLVVIPTISWSDPDSFEYSFDSIETSSCVAVSTIGCRKREDAFMDGYREMVKKIKPENVICYGESFPAMSDLAPLVEIEYAVNTTISYRKS
jgi:hypothetical protein